METTVTCPTTLRADRLARLLAGHDYSAESTRDGLGRPVVVTDAPETMIAKLADLAEGYEA